MSDLDFWKLMSRNQEKTDKRFIERGWKPVDWAVHGMDYTAKIAALSKETK